MNSFLQPIGRKKFLIYWIIWFLSSWVSVFLVITFLSIAKPGLPENKSLDVILENGRLIFGLVWLFNILLYYKRIKDIIEASYDEPNYYFLLLIPVWEFFIIIKWPLFFPALISRILDMLAIVVLVFLVSKKGKI